MRLHKYHFWHLSAECLVIFTREEKYLTGFTKNEFAPTNNLKSHTVCVCMHVTGELLVEFSVSRRNKEEVILSTWSDDMGDTLRVLTWNLD